MMFLGMMQFRCACGPCSCRRRLGTNLTRGTCLCVWVNMLIIRVGVGWGFRGVDDFISIAFMD